MERSRGSVCRTGGPFPIAFRCAAVSWFKLTHYRLAGGSLSSRDRSMDYRIIGIFVTCDR